MLIVKDLELKNKGGQSSHNLGAKVLKVLNVSIGGKKKTEAEILADDEV